MKITRLLFNKTEKFMSPIKLINYKQLEFHFDSTKNSLMFKITAITGRHRK